MTKQAKYYLGRVLKRGELTASKIAEAMREPVAIEYRGTRYSFIDFQAFGAPGNETGFYAKIAKYRQLGAVEVVREDRHASAAASVPNLIDVASPFVYLPGFSGLAYRHIWNAFPSEQFEKVFKDLVEAKFQKFFVGCDIESIADLRTFVTRLAGLDRITELQATVFPPNPLFGPCWKSLSEYLLKRKLKEATIKEEGLQGIETKLPEIAAAILANMPPDQMLELMEPLLDGLGDAALLMAADGYGRARVKGSERGRDVIIRTSENQKSFLFEGDPHPLRLFEHAFDAFKKINDERGLEHP
jgi:hypothetical protein